METSMHGDTWRLSRLILMVAVLLLGHLLAACSSPPDPARVSNRDATISKYAGGEEELPAGAETFASVDAAARTANRRPAVPRLAPAEPERVVVWAAEPSVARTEGRRPVELVYGNFEVMEWPVETTAVALAGVEEVLGDPAFAEYGRTVSIAGRPGYAHDEVDVPLKSNDAGDREPGTGIHVSGHMVLWADGDTVRRVTSSTMSSRRLQQIAESLYAR